MFNSSVVLVVFFSIYNTIM